jgi:glycosyltransferase involved in cell wall biosynthesis/predicted O-methyltransferase YrrM
MRWAAGAHTVVELGVAEGGSAAELRSVMSPRGRLYLVDPYEPGRLGVSMARVVARRTVGEVRGASVTWLRSRSDDAVRGWNEQIDFLFIDADHSYERASSDWRLWTLFVPPGGCVAMHDSVVFPGGWTDPDTGPVRLLQEILRGEPDWELVGQADSTSVLRRRSAASGESALRRPVAREDDPELRILRVADVSGVATAGMSGYMLSSAKEIEGRGHRVSCWFRDQLAPRFSNPGLRRLLVPWLIAAKVILAERGGERYDAVEIHEPLCAPYATLARLLPSRLAPCVALSHGLEERGWDALRAHQRAHGSEPRLRRRILVPLTLLSQTRAGLRAADAVLVVSSTDREHLVGRLGIAAERVSCAFGGVSEELLRVRRMVDVQPRVLFLGSWIERKGILELVEAWRRLAVDRPGVRLTIAGVGDSDRARADTRDLPGAEVVGTVTRDDLAGLLSSHNVFVLPSWFEGLPLSMLEAAAAGLACIVTAVCGNLDVFRPEDPQRDGAILFPPNESDALYRALLAVVDDPGLRDALGARARERARQFTWARNAEQALAGYRGAIALRAARRTAR